uniref:NAD-dependent protein deacylase n=1 Tax=Panagrellus redivivus TaxID=6233 RepID=A0A7E4VJ17_PANRE
MSLNRFVPPAGAISAAALKEFKAVLADVDSLLVMTGAGISTESGIPDYRSKGVGLYARPNGHRPMTIQEFLASGQNRQRYWARNFVAWPKFGSAPCNETHYKLAEWEGDPRFQWLITQNVDGLHTLAGSQRITELHGCSRAVKCLQCHEIYDRADLQTQLNKLNPNWALTEIGELRPDGDVDIPAHAVDAFKVPECVHCGPSAILKPDVVFFGDNVPRKVVDNCYKMVDDASGLLVLGSSLTVMSGYRFVYQAHLRGIPVLIVNIGPTRGDHFATVKLDARVSDVMNAL